MIVFNPSSIRGSPALHCKPTSYFPASVVSVLMTIRFRPEVLPEAGLVLLTWIDAISEIASMGHIEASALRIQTAPCNKSPTFRKWKHMTGSVVRISLCSDPALHIIIIISQMSVRPHF